MMLGITRLVYAHIVDNGQCPEQTTTCRPIILTSCVFYIQANEQREQDKVMKKVNDERLESRVDAALASPLGEVTPREAAETKSDFQMQVDEKKKKAMERVESREQNAIEEDTRMKEQRAVEERERKLRLASKEAEAAKSLGNKQKLEATTEQKKVRKTDPIALSPPSRDFASTRTMLRSPLAEPMPPRPEQRHSPKERRGGIEQGLSLPVQKQPKPVLGASSLDNRFGFSATSPPKEGSRKQRKLQFDRLAKDLKADGCSEKEVNLCLDIEDLEELKRLHWMKKREVAKKEKIVVQREMLII